MDLNISEANKFISYHAKPQSLGEKDILFIQDLILKYPYCQSLQFLATQAAKNSSAFEMQLAKASVFTSSREILYQFVNYTDSFETEAIELDETLIITEPTNEEVEIKDFGQAFGVDLNRLVVAEQEKFEEETVIEEPLAEGNTIENIEEVTEPTAQEETVEEETVIEEPLAEENTVENIEEVTEPIAQEEILEEETVIEEPLAEENTIENIEEVTEPTAQEETVEEETVIEEPLAEENTVENIEEVTEPVAQEEILEKETVIEEPLAEENTVENIEEVTEPVAQEEILEEETVIEEPLAEENIVENIEEVTEPTAQEEKFEQEIAIDEPLAEENIVENIEESAEIKTQTNTDKIELIFDSPVASDFFAFAKSEKTEPSAEPKEIAKTEQPLSDEKLTPYNDERMPYTFLWWLNKTRKEHEANTQPYAPSKTTQKAENKTEQPTDSLNQQIAANIFQLRSVDEIEQTPQKGSKFPFDFRKKELNIIEKFIKEEPQIKPPAANKIDTENKAKKSSEDSNEVVSETLAKIYVEQMLYHKALDVYKKLSLKYPEKSAYFASQIKYLELKVN